jgi:hypothetical protein
MKTGDSNPLSTGSRETVTGKIGDGSVGDALLCAVSPGGATVSVDWGVWRVRAACSVAAVVVILAGAVAVVSGGVVGSIARVDVAPAASSVAVRRSGDDVGPAWLQAVISVSKPTRTKHKENPYFEVITPLTRNDPNIWN